MAVDQDTLDVHQKVIYYLTLVLGSSGIILNILSVRVLFKVKYQEFGPHLILLKSLAFADLMVCVIAILKETSKQHFGPQLYTIRPHWDICLFNAIFEQCSFAYTATFLTLILIAGNQYVAITKPPRYNQLVTGRRLGVAVALVWIVSLLIHCIDLFRAMFISQLSDLDDEFCIILFTFKTWRRVAIPWKVFATLVGVGLIALCALYIKIFIVARTSLKQSDALSLDINHHRKARRHSLYTSLLLLGTFLLVYVPYCAVYATKEVQLSLFTVKRELYTKARNDYIMSTPCDVRGNQTMCPDNETNIVAQRNLDRIISESEAMWAAESQLRLITSYMEPILLVNAICDPLIYMIKMASIRKVYKQMMCYFCIKTSGSIYSGS